MMKPLNIVCFVLFLLGVVMCLMQLWGEVWSPDTFAKLIITDGAVFVVSFVWAFLVKENKESQKIDRGNSLD